MLFLLFAGTQAFTVNKICNYYRGTDVQVNSMATGDDVQPGFNYVVTIPSLSCVDQSLETSNMMYELWAELSDGSQVYNSELSFDVTGDVCPGETVAFVVPESGTNNPTLDLSYGADACDGTDIYVHNYCMGSGTVMVEQASSSGVENTTLAYFESGAVMDLKSDDVSGQAVYTWTNPLASIDGYGALTHTVDASDISNSPKTIHLLIYGSIQTIGYCLTARVDYTPSSSASLFTLLAVVFAMLQF